MFNPNKMWLRRHLLNSRVEFIKKSNTFCTWIFLSVWLSLNSINDWSWEENFSPLVNLWLQSSHLVLFHLVLNWLISSFVLQPQDSFTMFWSLLRDQHPGTDPNNEDRNAKEKINYNHLKWRKSSQLFHNTECLVQFTWLPISIMTQAISENQSFS